MMNRNLQVGRRPKGLGWNRLLNTLLQEVNVQNMNVELVAQMFKNYQSNVLFHLEGKSTFPESRGSRSKC